MLKLIETQRVKFHRLLRRMAKERLKGKIYEMNMGKKKNGGRRDVSAGKVFAL